MIVIRIGSLSRKIIVARIEFKSEVDGMVANIFDYVGVFIGIVTASKTKIHHHEKAGLSDGVQGIIRTNDTIKARHEPYGLVLDFV